MRCPALLLAAALLPAPSAVRAQTGAAGTLPVKCGFPAVAAALRGEPDAPGAFGRTRAAMLSRPVLQRSVLVQTASGPVRLHYDTSGTDAPALLDASYRRIPGSAHAFADSAAAAVRRTVQREVVELGYPMPPEDGSEGGGPEFDVYILELGALYGETVPEMSLPPAPSAPRYTSFTRVDNDFIFVTPDSNKGVRGLQVTMAHEFHHAVQLGNYGFRQGEQFFHEITSVWLEEEVFPDVNDYLTYLRSAFGHFRNPEVPFDSEDFIMYSRGIFGIYAARRHGPGVMRACWENIRSARALTAIDDALHAAPGGSGLRVALAEWALWNAFTGPAADSVRYYPEGHLYPAVAKSWVDMPGSSRAIDGSLEALGSSYYAVRAGADTLVLIAVNINLDAALAESTGAYPYTFLLNRAQPDAEYRETAAGIYYKFSAPDPGEWYAWDIARNGVGVTMVPEGSAFPNPFRSGAGRTVAFPVQGSPSAEGELAIYSAGLTKVFAVRRAPESWLGMPVFRWDGRNDRGEPAGSGVYVFVLETEGRTVKGKFVLFQEER